MSVGTNGPHGSRRENIPRRPASSEQAPASTVAAQIVSNYARSGARSDAERRAELKKLLDDPQNLPSAEQPADAARLLLVVSEAGIDPLIRAGPFDQDGLLEVAESTLLFVRDAVAREPSLLFHAPATAAAADGSANPPLVVWLVLRFLRAGVHREFGRMRDGVPNLIASWFDALLTVPESDLRLKGLNLVRFILGCINDLLEPVDAQVSRVGSAFPEHIIPSTRTLSSVWQDATRSFVVPQACRYEVSSVKHTAKSCIVLFESLLGVRAELWQRGSMFPISNVANSTITSTRRLLPLLFQATRRTLSAKDANLLVCSLCRCCNRAAHVLGNLPGDVSTFAPQFLMILLSFLSFICSNTSESTQQEIASSLLHLRKLSLLDESVLSLALEYIPARVGKIIRNQSLESSLTNDFKLALRCWEELSQGDPTEDVVMQDAPPAPSAFENGDLQNQFEGCLERGHFRLRTAPGNVAMVKESSKPLYNDLLGRVFHVFPVKAGDSAETIRKILSGAWDSLTDDSIRDAFHSLGLLFCVAVTSASGEALSMETFDCPMCDLDLDSDVLPPSGIMPNFADDWARISALISALLAEPRFIRSRKPRVYLANAIRRLATHVDDEAFLNVSKGAVGQWCLKSLHSSLRELQQAAARTLCPFLRQDLPDGLCRNNRLCTLNYLRSLSARGPLRDQEAIILAWGQVARVCGEEELNIALLQFVEYLGHSHVLISAIAFTELLSLASDKGCAPELLFKPFWRSIAITVVRDLHTRPQKIQQLAELLGFGVNQFLWTTQMDTVPYLVLLRKRDILERIASARVQGKPLDLYEICLQKENLSVILAHLLMQHPDDADKAAISILSEVAPQFGKESLSTLVNLEPILIACEMFKLAADHESTDPRLARAIRTLAVLAADHKISVAPTTKGAEVTVVFFQTHILGIMTHFADIIGSPVESQPIAEKRRCLKAVEAMIEIDQVPVSRAVPQIRACLQSALSIQPLCDQVIRTWTTFASELGDDDIDLVLEPTFVVVVRQWKTLSALTQKRVEGMLQFLFKRHSAVIKERAGTLPSLEGIHALSKFANVIKPLRAQMDEKQVFQSFARRCSNENAAVVEQALEELKAALELHQIWLQQSVMSQQPSQVIADLCRSVLDASVKFAEGHPQISSLASECLGAIGCIDPNRIDSVREKEEVIILSNFNLQSEACDFVVFMLENVLVQAFKSATNARAQNYLAYVMQELLKFCDFQEAAKYRFRGTQGPSSYQRWSRIPEPIRMTLTPYLSSRYLITRPVAPTQPYTYPIYHEGMTHGSWLRTFTYDLLHRGNGQNAKLLFPIFSRVIRQHDLAIADSLLPFVVLNIVVGGIQKEVDDILVETLTVLQWDIRASDAVNVDAIKLCSENIFRCLDYLSRWLQEKRKSLSERSNRHALRDPDVQMDQMMGADQITSVEKFLSSVPAEVISTRATECGSYARALFHTERSFRKQKKGKIHKESTETAADDDEAYQRLQALYAAIDEPDAIEGISAQLHVLGPDHQLLEHKKAGRWTAVQSWYELEMAEKPDDQDVKVNLLTSLREAGRYEALLNHASMMVGQDASSDKFILPLAVEAAWATSNWEKLEQFINVASGNGNWDFNVGIGKSLMALKRNALDEFRHTLGGLRDSVSRSFTSSNTVSLQSCHDLLLKLHCLYELQSITTRQPGAEKDPLALLQCLDSRLEILGSYTSEKQYVLGLRRAAMQVADVRFTESDQAIMWLKSAKLARKAGAIDSAYDAVLHASRLSNEASRIEHSRLLWDDGHHRKAIQNLESALAMDVLDAKVKKDGSMAVNAMKGGQHDLGASATLLLAKWMDSAGSTRSEAVVEKYRSVTRDFPMWEKGHYYLGKHYNKQLESQQKLPRAKQSQSFVAGEHWKLVIENYMRSIQCGTKHLYLTLPKVLTLWLELGATVHALEEKAIQLNPRSAQMATIRAELEGKTGILDQIHQFFTRCLDRIPAYAYYTALPQIISRMGHPHPAVNKWLSGIIMRVTSSYPRQALWSLLAVAKSAQVDKAQKQAQAEDILKRLKAGRQGKHRSSDAVANLVTSGHRLTMALLRACEAPVDARRPVTLSRDLGVRHTEVTPCGLVVPVETALMPTLPVASSSQALKSHEPFPRNAITIESFEEHVLVLSSLQRPKKITLRGSDGKLYGLLCKPKDDLRKDQRLMEFNNIINRTLKKDTEGGKRRLYIKTYAVTPLNEECGVLEWVEGLKPIRDFLLDKYKQIGAKLNHDWIKNQLTIACKGPDYTHYFSKKLLGEFPPMLHEWFVEKFPEPGDWFTARLRFTRSCAVMSMVGNVLGLGDRHCENILLEEGSGGLLHVDFNCLFDKGLGLETPETVPFRLTHNFVDAFGPYGVEGPFRIASEITTRLLRANEDTLMTTLETFLYDPTVDFRPTARKRAIEGVPTTPEEILESVRAKVQGLFRGEVVPLGVEGYVDALIKMASDPENLKRMYVGWSQYL